MFAIIGAFNNVAIDKPRVSNSSLRVDNFDVFQHRVVVGLAVGLRFTRDQGSRDVLVHFRDITRLQGAVVGPSLVAARKDGGVVAVAGAVKLRRTLVPFILVVVFVALIEIADDRLHLQRVHDGLFEQFRSRARVRR